MGCENFSARGRVRGAAPPNVNLGPHHISETIRAGKLKILHTIRQGQILVSGVKFFRKGRPRGAAPHSVNSGPPHISETIRARKLKFYTQ